MVTIKELKKISIANGKPKRWREKILRLGGTYLSWFFIKLPITANQVTFLMLLVGIISAIMFAVGSYFYSLIGILLFSLYLFIDYADGNVARYKKMCSFKGAYLDIITHIIVNSLVLFCISIGVYFNNPTPIPNYLFLIAGFISAWCFLMKDEIIFWKRQIYIQEVQRGNLNKLKKIKHSHTPPHENKIKLEILDFLRVGLIFNFLFFATIFNLLPYIILPYCMLRVIYFFQKFFCELKLSGEEKEFI
ncbi:hypothetical protein ES703_57763 [subsurface metagenome]